MMAVFWRRSFVLTAAVGAAALSLYVATLAPGLIAIEDTPKFQFVGRILGTAHPPGYPFYVLLSHVFGLLPLGDLAWRINLLSAICAALTIVFYQLAMIELGVAPAIAALAGLGLATGGGFWFAATIAEVYSLHGCIVAAMTFALLRWRRSGRCRWFFTAIGLFSIGLGHHTSIVTLGPAVAIFAIAVAPRFALSPKTIATILGLFALGFSQYLFVLVRTRQGAWGESPASNLSELFDVIRGARWTSYLAPVAMDTLTSRVPGIVRLLTDEVSLFVLVAAIAGLIAIAQRDRPLLGLVVGSIAGVVGFSTFFSGQTQGFLQPVFFFLWLLAAIGVDAIVRVIPRMNRHATSIAALVLIVVVAWHGSHNLEARDLSHRRFDMRYFDALTRQLPPHSGLLAEDFLVDRMVLYEKFSQPLFAERDLAAQVEAVPDRVREFSARGYGLFAFRTSAARLRQEGVDFDYAMWPLEYGSLRQYLLDQPSGTVVAIAVPAMRLPTALTQDAVPLDVIGGRIPQPSWSNLAAVGVIGRSSSLQADTRKERSSVFAGRGLAIAGTRVLSPTDILAEAVDDSASIRIGSRAIIRSREPVVALWGPGGQLVNAFALNAAGRVPMPDSPLSVHRLRGVRTWTPIASSSADLTSSAATGHVMIRQASSDSPVVIYAGRRQRMLAPRLYDIAGGVPPLVVQEYAGGGRELHEAIVHDGGTADSDLQSMRYVYRIELPASAGTFHLGFGGIPDMVLSPAMLRSAPSPHAAGEAPSFYPLDLAGQLEPIDAATDRLHVARDHHQLFLASGWSPISADETGAFAMITADAGEILLPCEPRACSTVDLQLWTSGDDQTVGLAVNGTALPEQVLRSGWNVYRWKVPSAALHAGVNSFVVRPGLPTRLADILIAKAPAR